jgi:hypothetical protein
MRNSASASASPLPSCARRIASAWTEVTRNIGQQLQERSPPTINIAESPASRGGKIADVTVADAMVSDIIPLPAVVSPTGSPSLQEGRLMVDRRALFPLVGLSNNSAWSRERGLSGTNRPPGAALRLGQRPAVVR